MLGFSPDSIVSQDGSLENPKILTFSSLNIIELVEVLFKLKPSYNSIW